MANFPAGADDRADAPLAVVGMQSLPTRNVTFGPLPQDVFTENPNPQGEWDYSPGDYWDEYVEPFYGWAEQPPAMTAWWKYVADVDGYVAFDCFDSHILADPMQDPYVLGLDPASENYQRNVDYYVGLYKYDYPETFLAVYDGDDMFPLAGANQSMPLDLPPGGLPEDHGYKPSDYRPTSQTVVRVTAGKSYYIQVGVDDRWGDPRDAPYREADYILTCRRAHVQGYEFISPATNIYDAPQRHSYYDHSVLDPYDTVPEYRLPAIIVGGSEALATHDSGSYVDFDHAVDRKGPRLSIHTTPLVGQPNWPPPADNPGFRMPGELDLQAVQFAVRYRQERPDTSIHFATALSFEGNQDDEYQFNMGSQQWPNLGSSQMFTTDPPDWPNGPVTTTMPVLSSTEDFLATGDIRAFPYKLWAYPPFMFPNFQARRLTANTWPYEPFDDYGLWFGSHPIGAGLQLAALGDNQRITWMEFIVRYHVWTLDPLDLDIPDPPVFGPNLTGQLLDTGQRFQGARTTL